MSRFLLVLVAAPLALACGAAGPSISATAAPPAVSCVAQRSCSEMHVDGVDASQARERCVDAGGEPRDAACSREKLVGTCVLAEQNATAFTYQDPDPEVTRGLASGAKSGCEAIGGSYTPAE